MTTIERLRSWLSNPVNRHVDEPYGLSISPDKPDRIIMRSRFVTTNGISLSIQQGATHYCTHDSVELWCCPHHQILEPYGDGEHPYARVPLVVIAQYIDALEAK
jgi:hypothetical protein